MEKELELNERLDMLWKKYKKTLLWHRIIFLSVSYILLIAVMVAIIVIFKDKGGLDSSVISVVSSSVAVGLLFSSGSICTKYSKKLRALKQEITDLSLLLDVKVNEDNFEKIISPNAQPSIVMPAIKKDYVISNKEKFAVTAGFICIVLAMVLMFVAIAIEKLISVPLFIGLIIIMFWIEAYGMFLAFTRKWLYSLYYPSVCMAIIAGPPCITAFVASNFAEWILILSTCLAGVLSIVLFCVFLYFNFTKPTKEKKKFVEENKQIIEEKQEEDIFYWYNKNGDYATIVRLGQFKFLATIYDVNNIKLNEQAFVEYSNAVYFVYKSLIDLKKQSRL